MRVADAARLVPAVVHRLLAPPLLPPSLGVVWADQGYTGPFAEWLHATRGCRLQVVRHPERQVWRYGLEEKPTHTFRVLPGRWVVERTFAWLGQSRRLSKDYERLPAKSEAMIYGTMTRLMLPRLALRGAPHAAEVWDSASASPPEA
jgi:transposase